MKSLTQGLVLAVALSQLISCDDSEKMPTAWGTMKTDSSPKETEVNGVTLGQSNADYQGFCRYKNKKFSFAIGEKAPPSTNLYWFLDGIEGPPSKNPYDDAGELRTDDDKNLKSGEIWTTEGAWVLSEDLVDNDKCNVVLFAEGDSGDLTPKKYGKKHFQYVLKIICHGGLDNIPNEYDPTAGPDLTGFVVELWFDHCDS